MSDLSKIESEILQTVYQDKLKLQEDTAPDDNSTYSFTDFLENEIQAQSANLRFRELQINKDDSNVLSVLRNNSIENLMEKLPENMNKTQALINQ